MDGTLAYLGAGLILGLAAGLAPGPMLAMVITQTLRHGPREGVRVAFAPLITDIPIILIATVLLARVADNGPILGVVSLGGGVLLAYLGYESLRTKGLEIHPDPTAPRSLAKGVLVNALNPHPYLFWLTVGAPSVLRALDAGWLPPTLYLGGFYLCLVGSKAAIALLAGRSRAVLTGRAYVYTMRGLGMLLLAYSFALLRDAVHRLS